MFAEERQRAIVARAQANGRVDVAALAEEFGVTAETIRRDLGGLERAGLLRRVHGGAIVAVQLPFEPDMSRRGDTMGTEKERIAKAALALLPAEGAIFIESGSTTGRLAELLPAENSLTVVTNSVAIALTLTRWPELTVMTVGGRVRRRTHTEVDDWALRNLQSLRVDVAFLGTNGISVKHGLSTPDPAEAAVKRAALGVARRRVLLVDHTKYGNESVLRYGGLDDIDVLVTDNGLAADSVEDLRASGVEVVLA